MSDTKPLPSLPLSTLHVIGYIRWEREWYDTLEINRVKLLDQLASMLDQMGGGVQAGTTLRFYLMSGQTAVIEDIASIRSDLVTLLVIYNGSGRLGIGPWYIHVDQRLVSGEALIRNLLMGREDAIRYGIKLMPIAYMPDAAYHSAQLPQILRGFGINTAFLRYDARTDTPFYWEAPDGSNIMVLGHETPTAWQERKLDDIKDSIRLQELRRPDGPYLWLLNYDDTKNSIEETLHEIEKFTGLATIQSDVPEYMRVLRRSISGAHRALVAGRLKPTTKLEKAHGMLSSRLYLKQTHARLQAYLSYVVEPLVTVALTYGDVKHPNNLRALLHHTWRQLLKTQAKNALGGISSDAVHQKSEQRNQAIHDTVQQLTFNALSTLPGTPHNTFTHTPQGQSHTVTYVVIWNGHNWPVEQVVEVPLRLPDGYFPSRLRAPGDDTSEQIFGWRASDESDPDDISGTLVFLANAPGIGYATYTIELSKEEPETHHLARIVQNRSIGNVAGETLRVEGGKLIWTRANGAEITDLLQFYDGGDAGDAYQYQKPHADVVAKAQLVDDVHVVSSPLYERLVINHRMRIATGLEPDGRRKRGLRLLELTTTATFYDHIPGLYLKTTFSNTANDHRLRAHIQTGINSDTVLTNSAFGVDKHDVGSLHDMQTLSTVQSDQDAIAIIARGLPEVESINEDNQVTMALTLLRAVGWLSKEGIDERTLSPAPQIATDEGQCERTITVDYGLVAIPPNDNSAIIRHARMFESPLQAFQYDNRPERPRRSYLSIVSDLSIGGESDGEGAIVTAFKPPMKGRGWVVRLYNPHDNRACEVFVTPHMRPDQVYLLTMAEETLQFIETDGNGRVLVQIEPQQIITLKFVFEP